MFDTHMYVTPTIIAEVFHLVSNKTHIETDDLLWHYYILIMLVSFMMCFLTKATSMDRIALLHFKFSKLAQIVIQVGTNVVNSLGMHKHTNTQTYIHTFLAKYIIFRIQVHACFNELQMQLNVVTD